MYRKFLRLIKQYWNLRITGVRRLFLKRKLNILYRHTKQAQLHVGCGDDYLSGFINVDVDPCSRADLILGEDDYSIIPTSSVERIESYHFLEHLTYAQARRYLRHFFRVLKPGGSTVIEMPNLAICIENIGKHYDPKGIDLAMVGIYGYPPDIEKYGVPLMHKWGWTKEALVDELSLLGFENVVSQPVKQSGRAAAAFGRDMSIVATKPESLTHLNNNLLYARRNRIAYIPIPKVACTSIKFLLLKIEGHEYNGAIDRGFHDFVREMLTSNLGRFDRALRSLDHGYTFTVVRNPWDRLVSAYIDKFVRAKEYEDFALEVILSIRGSSDVSLGISFREYLNYISNQHLLQMNDHWRPQWWFVAGLGVDRIIKYESLEEDLRQLLSSRGVNVDLPHINRSSMKVVELRNRNLCLPDMFPSELRSLGGYPAYHSWYDNELLAVADRVFRKDIELFGYNFDG